MSPAAKRVLGATAAAVVLATVVAALASLGSPGAERARRIDERRVADLRGIAGATDLYWTRHARLPSSLAELTAEPGVEIVPADPARATPYEYRAVDSVRYEVCATFDAASRPRGPDQDPDLWAHGPGHQCFRLDAEEVERRER